MLGVVRGVPGDRAPISIRIVIHAANEMLVLNFEALKSCSPSGTPR